jgi:ornithine cyclodeaminase/alanine dehydrogenase
MVLLLSRKDIESFLTIQDTIDVVEEAFKEYERGTVKMPLRSVIAVEKHGGSVLYMPALLQGMGALGVKVVSVYAKNPTEYNLPTTIGVVLLNDPKNGSPIAIMDGSFLTAMRTGAVSGVATKYLARKNAKELGIIGTGVQGRMQVAAVCKVRPIEKVKAYDIAPDQCSRFCEQISKDLGVQSIQAHTPEEAVRNSDIVVTSSSSKEPVLKSEWLDAGTHINAIGSHTPNAREIDAPTIKRAKIIVDTREAALKEAGDIMIPIAQGIITPEHIFAELGEIVTGKKQGRVNDDEITLFKSQGLAIQDVSTAWRIYELATKKGIGKSITL